MRLGPTRRGLSQVSDEDDVDNFISQLDGFDMATLLSQGEVMTL